MNQIFHVSLDKANNSLIVEIGKDGKSMWTIKWDEGEADHLQAMWQRKFKRCVPAGIRFPDVVKKKKKVTL